MNEAWPQLRGRKLVIVLGWFGMGGAERQALLLARELKKRGVQVEIWAFFPGRARAQCHAWGIPSRLLRWPLSLGRVRSLSRLLVFGLRLRGARPDWVLPYTTVASTIVGASWKISGARAGFWNQRDEGRDIHGGGSQLQRLAVKNCSLILANSQHAANMMCERFGLPAERTLVVKNGIEVAPAREAETSFRARWQLPPQAPLVAMIANLHQHKDHATLLDAWHLLLQNWNATGEKPVLLLAGREGDTASKLHAQAERLQLQQNVRFLGDVEDIGALLNVCQMTVHSSQREGVPNALLEAMSCGLPVVGTDIPGIREALGIDVERAELSDAENAQIAPIGDATTLAERINILLGDADLRARLGKQNRAHIQAHWSPQIMCDQFCEILARYV